MRTASVFAPGRLPRILLAETRAEFLKQVRLPAYVIPSIAFPALFYIVFGLAFGDGPAPGGVIPMKVYMLATYGTFGVVGAAMFGLGVGIATERGQGWLATKQASPMPPVAYFAAKVAMSMGFGAAIVLVLAGIAITFAGVRLPAAAWLGLGATLVLGAAPFCALGSVIGFLLGPNSAPAVTNLIYLPLALASGLWIPVELLPSAIRAVAPFMPAYHLARIALHSIGGSAGSVWPHVAALGGFTVLFLALAVLAYRHDQGKSYG